MSLNDAPALAFSLATILMASIVIFLAGDGTLSVTPAAAFDGDAEVIAEIDPFAPCPGERCLRDRGTPVGFRSRLGSSSAILFDAPWWWWWRNRQTSISRRPPT
jgi:hypothetical protein